jgi:hypothetical protein
MIWDSWPWKCDLAMRAQTLRRRMQQRRWPETSLAAVERDVFLSAYEVRKLLDAKKISDEVESRLLRAKQFSATGHPIDIMNWHKIDKLYDLSRHLEADVLLRDFCNQVIHSLIFLLSFSANNGLDGFFIVSDYESKRKLFYFSIDSVISVLLSVANDDIVYVKTRRDKVGERMKITRKSNRQGART